jgi:hypothetical protein
MPYKKTKPKVTVKTSNSIDKILKNKNTKNKGKYKGS